MTISLVQSDFSSPATAVSATTGTATLGSGITQGNLLVASYALDNNGLSISQPDASWQAAIVDSNPDGQAPESGVMVGVAWLLIDATHAGGTSWTWGDGAASQNWVLSVSEWHSSNGWPAGTDAEDQLAAGYVSTSFGVSVTLDSGTTPLTEQGEELWFAAFGYGGQAETISGVTSGWTQDCNADPSASPTIALAVFHQLASSIGYANVNFTIGDSGEYWTGVVVTFEDNSGTAISSSDSGTGTDKASVPRVTLAAAADSGTGTDTGLVPGSMLFPASSDSGTGTDTGVVAGLAVASADWAAGADNGRVTVTGPVTPALPAGVIFEGFSLSRASVLGTNGLESAQLYGAQSGSVTPDVTVVENMTDDDVYSIWYVMSTATIQVTNGFMPFSVIAQLSGTAVASSGASPADYYALPLWTQYQHNRPVVPVVLRMDARNTQSAIRTLDMVLYAVQISVLDFTGVAYKSGLGVSYAGKALLSSVDEAGNSLAGPEIGRVISAPGALTGSIGPEAFRGL